MKADASPAATPDASAPTSPAVQAPKERPRLNLAKRTVSTAEQDTANPSGSDSKASPFGAAKPIDTATRDRALEEKRQVAIREKKESDDKAREAKAAQDAAARAARADRADRGQAQEEDKVTSPTTSGPRGNRRPSRSQNGSKQGVKENGEAPQRDRPSFSILQRDEEDAAAQETQDGEQDVVDAPANGTIVGDKETKPQEVVREVSKDETTAQNTETSAQAMEDDGWSTVGNKSKKGGRPGQRAMAS